MHPFESHEEFVPFALRCANGNRDTPIPGKNAEDVLERVRGVKRVSGKANHFVVHTNAESVKVRFANLEADEDCLLTVGNITVK